MRLALAVTCWFAGLKLEGGQVAPLSNFYRTERAAIRRMKWYRTTHGPDVGLYCARVDVDSVELAAYAGQ